MQTFAYTALESSGKRRTGVLDAASKEAAMAILSSEGRYVLEISEQKAQVNIGSRTKAASRQDIALFTRRMADLAGAGLPLDRVLSIVAEQSESQQLHDIALAVLEEVRGGKPVSDALADFPKTFPQVFTQTLKAGEASGQFSEVATRLADFQEMEVARRSQVISSLIYPGILGCTALGVMTFLIAFVIPQISKVFTSMHGELPTPTKILLAVSSFVTGNALLIIIAIVGAVVGYRLWVATELGAYTRDSLALRLPVAGAVIRKATVSRFARVLSTLLFGGVPILEALSIAGLSAGNKVYVSSVKDVSHDVREGKAIADAMRDTGAFPAVLTHMVAIGEETGDVPKMLNRVADSMDFEVDTGLRRLTSMAEPIIVLCMGGFVGFAVTAIILPILGMNELVK